MRSLEAIVLALLCIPLSHAQVYECTNESDGDREFCVFRDVTFLKNTTGIEFIARGGAKPVNVAFKDCNMVGIPGKFLDEFADNLKILKVENCKLQSVTITRNMEALYASNNVIEKVLIQQNGMCSSLTELDLSNNRLRSVANITNCEKLEVLRLGGNSELFQSNTIDLSIFENLNLLRELDLSNNGVLYLDNNKNIELPSLKLLDLSRNDLLPADLRFQVMEPFTALETLRLNDNKMVRLDYAELLYLKSLKTVHLNGNNFECRKVKEMVGFLNEKNIATPLERHNNCEDREYEGMCCNGPYPTTPRPVVPTTTRPSPSSSTQKLPVEQPTNPTNDADGSLWYVWVLVVGIIVAAASGAGYLVHKKRSN